MKKKFSIFNFQFSIECGFTLIELLVVISVLGLLAGLIVSNVSGIRERARDAQRKNDLNQIKSALKMYHNDYDDYPAAGASGAIVGCGTTESPAGCEWGGQFKKDNTIFMTVLPKDPSWSEANQVTYFYSRVDRDTFSIYALLENKSDGDILSSQLKCGGSATANAYYVCAD